MREAFLQEVQLGEVYTFIIFSLLFNYNPILTESHKKYQLLAIKFMIFFTFSNLYLYKAWYISIFYYYLVIIFFYKNKEKSKNINKKIYILALFSYISIVF